MYEEPIIEIEEVELADVISSDDESVYCER